MHLVFPRVNLTSAAYITVLENTEEEIIDNQVVRMSFFFVRLFAPVCI